MARAASPRKEEGVRERPAWLIPVTVLGALGFLSGAILLYYFAAAPDLLMPSVAIAQRPEQIIEASIGDNRFLIRERYVRAIVENGSGEAESIEMHVPWPPQLADPPEIDLSHRQPLDPATSLYVTLMPAQPEADSARRLEKLYPYYFDGPGTDAGNGLARYAMKAGSGYDDQEIFVGGEGERKFIARCFRQQTEEVPATCIRSRLIEEGLAVRYRFNRSLLPEWQQLEAGVTAFLEHLRAPSDSR